MGSRLLTVAEARERILGALHPLDREPVVIRDALDRFLAADLPAAGDVPPFSAAAMDGYAVASGPAGRTLRVVGEARAGVPSPVELRSGEAIRTSTGAAIPAGADAIIRQEMVEAVGERVTLRASVDSEKDIRLRGEDLAAGARVLSAGMRLGSAELAAAVAAGAGELTCARRPRIAIVCTGTELRAPGQPLGPGEIHNTNACSLRALATRAGAVPWPRRGCAADDPVEIAALLGDALREADVIVVSGGLSVGPHDYVKFELEKLGVLPSFWGVALQPGKPTWFGTRGRQAVFGLPGSPVAAYITFALFVAPTLLALQGARDQGACEQAELTRSVHLSSDREQALTVRLEHNGCRVLAVPNGPQGSSLISSLIGADALAMVPSGSGELAAGSPVSIVRLAR